MIDGNVVEEVVGAAVRPRANVLNHRGARIVTNLRVVPVLLSAAVVTGICAFDRAMWFTRDFALRGVARPTTHVSFFICPQR